MLNISVDESVSTIILNEVETFCGIYNNAEINASYLPEQMVIEDFLSNKVPIAITTRMLSQDEVNYFKELKTAPHQIKMATDAIAIIINTENPDSNITYNQLLSILTGKIVTWKSLNNNHTDSIVLVFDNKHSSTYRFLKDEVLEGNEIASNVYAVDSTEAVINYVVKNRGAIGILSVSRLSNRADTTVKSFFKRVIVAGLTNPDSSNQQLYYKPNRTNIFYGRYPMLRHIYLLNREAYIGLGTGFATYMISEEGQLIFHLSGLVPAKNPVRVIEIKNEF